MKNNPSGPSRFSSTAAGLAAGLVLLVLFKLWLVRTDEIYGSATQYDALWYVNAAKNWYWGSDYSWTAFTRPPAYPLFIASVHLCGIPLRIGIELVQAAGYLALVAGLRKAGVPRSVCLASFAAMILHPGSFSLNTVTMADNFYAAILPLALGGLLLTLLTGKIMHAAWTGIALALLWNTREESFLIPAMLVVFFGVALLRQRSATGSWKEAGRSWLRPAIAMLGILAVLVLAVYAANYRTFQSFSKSELTASSFQATYKALLRIKPTHDQRFVSVSTEALDTAYKVSPTFRKLQPQFESELGRNWLVPAREALGLPEIGAPWFLWALRSAANSGGVHETSASAKRFYREAAREINRACDEGRVPSRFVLSSFLDPGGLASICYMPESFPRIAGLFLTRFQKNVGRDDATLTESQRALYDGMTRRSPARISREGVSVATEEVISSYHGFFVVALSVGGLGAVLLLAWRFRQLRITDSINAVLILLAAAILLRVGLFTFLDATWWIGGYERYLFPVMPLYSCFLIVLIYRTTALWRSAETTPRR